MKQFLELFNPYPGNHYMQVTTSLDDTTQALYELMKSVDGEFSLVLYEDEKEYASKFEDVKIKSIKSLNEVFRALPRSNDIIILKDIFFKHQNKEMILKTSYTSLANTADIIIMEKKGLLDISLLKQMLEEFEFRAPNEIDVVDGYDLVMAKKMHMWGNGL
jgi:predicted nicotinamide N-methyase